MAELTRLADLAGFDPALREALAPYWITTAEEFVGAVLAANSGRGSGLVAMAETLNLSQERVSELFDLAQAALPPGLSFSVAEDEFDEPGAGLLFEDLVDPPAAFGLELPDLPPEVAPLATLPPPISQGSRNSCVAFAMVSTYQALFARSSGDPSTLDLSEQFLYWACKSRDGHPRDVGTSPKLGLELFRDLGACREQTWPYDGTRRDENPGHAPPPAGAEAEAANFRISGFQQLGSKDVVAMRAALAAGQPVLVGLMIYQHWSASYQGRVLGRLRKPLPGESKSGGHAMALLGYREDAEAPGGGYFIVRNSWGSDWASEHPDGPGLCYVPFQLLADEGLAAFAVEGIVPPPPAALGSAPALSPQAELAAIRTRMASLADELGGLAARLATLETQLKGDA